MPSHTLGKCMGSGYERRRPTRQPPRRTLTMLTVIVGPPASGKSTWALANAKPTDIVIDYDRLALALSGLRTDTHEHTPAINTVTRAARTAAIDAAIKQAHTTDVYLIHSNPGPDRLTHYRAAGATIKVIDPGRDIVIHRCAKERPRRMLTVVDEWYQKWTPTTVESHTVTAIHTNPADL